MATHAAGMAIWPSRVLNITTHVSYWSNGRNFRAVRKQALESSVSTRTADMKTDVVSLAPVLAESVNFLFDL